VILSPGDHGLQIQTPQQSLHEAQQIVARHWHGAGKAVEMLREQRREEAEMDAQGHR
jgi:hypothetical protein